ncbi:hypothetical protein [Clostridium saccharoperbutylacetonicum]|uniref:hypothetical protein n=1 Tax=Clostridium saccharoperbutylacetonicum TaxID=36745 RepID=UPI0039E841DE
MIGIREEDLLKDTIDYEEYSENVCKLTIEELKAEGLLKCGGCCIKGENKENKCSNCKSKNSCKK